MVQNSKVQSQHKLNWYKIFKNTRRIMKCEYLDISTSNWMMLEIDLHIRDACQLHIESNASSLLIPPVVNHFPLRESTSALER